MLSSFDLLLISVSFIVMVSGFIGRYRMWKQGRPELHVENSKIRRIIRLLSYHFSHRRILEDRYPGILHLFIFWGFIIPFIIVSIGQFRTIMPLWGARGLSLLLDLIGALALVGTVMLLFRNFRDKKGQQKSFSIHLWVFLAILITGFLAEGIRLTIIESQNSFDALFSPAGLTFSYLIPGSPMLLKILIRCHFFLVLFFIASLPFSDMRHVIAATLNVYYQKKGLRGKIESIPLEGDYFGVGQVQDFTWKQLLDSDACVNCGRCEQNCPAFLSGQPLSPQKVVQWIGEKMEEAYALKRSGECYEEHLGDYNGTIGKQDIWSCTTCMACVQSCPVMVEHLDKIIDMRQYSVLTESKFPAEYKQIFKDLEIFHDPLGKGGLIREEWASNLKIKKMYQNNDIEILFWVGCIGALYDERSKNTTIAAAKVLEKAGINFGILGKEELCCGDPARRMGNEYLFQRLALENIEIFKKYKINKIVTYCPHGFNVFKNEYPQFGADFEVMHFTQFIKNFLEDGRLKIKSKIDGLFTYHDPCYFGRYNSIYQAPREILNFTLSSNIKEMPHSEDRSFCCGAGGGNFWRGKMVGRRMEEVRIEEAIQIKANGIVTACPFCEIMFDSAVKQKGLENYFKSMDILELVNQVT